VGGEEGDEEKVKMGDSMEYLAWPIAFLVGVIVFMVLFKKDISSLLVRVQKIGKDGIQTSPIQIQQPSEKESSIEELTKEFSSIAIRNQETNIKRDLENRGLSNPQDKINLLIKHLSIIQLALQFERINGLIWGSQVKILEHLNSRKEDSVAGLKFFYDTAYKLSPDVFTNYPFEQYLQFLIAFNLIVQQGEKLSITDIGREFLVYIAATGQTRWRCY